MKKLNAMEMRNVEGGAKCAGCGKNVWPYWVHKLFCLKYRQWKAEQELKQLF